MNLYKNLTVYHYDFFKNKGNVMTPINIKKFYPVSSFPTISFSEELLGFDQEFADRVKSIWLKRQIKTAFLRDLNTLDKRWSLSLYFEGAGMREKGLLGTLRNQALGMIAGVGLGTFLLWESTTGPRHRKAPLTAIMGTICIAAGLVFPIIDAASCISEAARSNLRAVVRKNFGAVSQI